MGRGAGLGLRLGCGATCQVLRPSLPTAGPTQEMSSFQLFAGKTWRYTATSGTPTAGGGRSVPAERSSVRMAARQVEAGEQLCGLY